MAEQNDISINQWLDKLLAWQRIFRRYHCFAATRCSLQSLSSLRISKNNVDFKDLKWVVSTLFKIEQYHSIKNSCIISVLALDESLRKMDPVDPVKYDFALFGLGIFEGF